MAAVEPGAEPALIAEEHACGVRVEPGDPGALAAAIREMQGAPLDEMGTNAREGPRGALRTPGSQPSPTGVCLEALAEGG